MLKIHQDALKVIELLNSNNYEAFLVGGCLRDLLLDKEPNDYDITTNALPSEIKEVFKDYKVIDVSGKCGTIIVKMNHNSYEITPYRLETAYLDHRHPSVVTFSKHIEDDLARRDFTVNAFAYHPNLGLIDLFNGQKDLENKVIRCIGDPNTRFQEDALRILRALRFSSKLCFSIDEETKQAIHKNKDLLQYISIERIMAEFEAIITSDKAYEIMMEYKDVITVFIPEIKVMFDYNQNCPYHMYDLYTHTLLALSQCINKFSIRLAALFHDIGKPKACKLLENGDSGYPNHALISYDIIVPIIKRFHLDNKVSEDVLNLVKYHHFSGYLEDISDIKLKEMIVTLGYDLLLDLLNFQDADAKSTHPDYFYPASYYQDIIKRTKKIYQSMDCFSIHDLKISGEDLMSKGYQGKQIGEKLNELFKLVLQDKIKNTHEDLLNQL